MVPERRPSSEVRGSTSYWRRRLEYPLTTLSAESGLRLFAGIAESGDHRAAVMARKVPTGALNRVATTNWGARREWSWQVTDNSTDFRFFASCNQLS